MKSERADNPLKGLGVRKMILTGPSASAGVAQNYLSNAPRLSDMKPIYDGMLPTSNNGQVPVIDIPTLVVPTMRQTAQGTGTMQKDNKKLRVYEFAGMAHIDSRGRRSADFRMGCSLQSLWTNSSPGLTKAVVRSCQLRNRIEQGTIEKALQGCKGLSKQGR
jgi:Alpha/beta hydrolase domain